MTKLSGRCRCGEVRWAAPGPMTWTALCHCESCRRAASAPFLPFFGLVDPGLVWSGPVTVHAGAGGAERGFCSACGSPLFYRNPVRWPGETHIAALTLDDPAIYRPKVHVYYGERLPWIAMRDGLPKYLTTGGDGTAPLSDEAAHG